MYIMMKLTYTTPKDIFTTPSTKAGEMTISQKCICVTRDRSQIDDKIAELQLIQNTIHEYEYKDPVVPNTVYFVNDIPTGSVQVMMAYCRDILYYPSQDGWD